MPKALVAHVDPGSPASLAGVAPGEAILSVDGEPLRDVIDWRWHAAEDEVELAVEGTDGIERLIRMVRDEGQDWGIGFDDILFDGTMQCKNACTFCFMSQLPLGSRPSLTLRDDDYRLSFLQGNFVTFTNLVDDDIERIIEQRISPLHFSLHATDSEVRRELIGKNAPRGLEVARRLLDAGIELFAQIVLVPGVNDGAKLAETLEWAYARPGILEVGIVPLGYTRHQDRFDAGFDTPEAARAVLADVATFQQRAQAERGVAWVHLSDEFYRIAYPDNLLEMVPPAAQYGRFGMFEDGIGFIRSFIDDFATCEDKLVRTADAISQAGLRVRYACGCAQREFLGPLLAASPCAGLIEPLYIENTYFGGNVDVTGLLCAHDIVPALQEAAADEDGPILAVIPAVVLNADGVTLDGATIAEMEEASGCNIHVVSCEASGFLDEIAALARDTKDAFHG